MSAIRVSAFILAGCPPLMGGDKTEKIIAANRRLAFYRAFRHFEPHLFFSDDQHKLVYQPITRAASSSILAYMSGQKTIKEQMGQPGVRVITERDLLRRYVSEGYFVFSFVRNPYSRLVSFFRQKYKYDAGDGFYHSTGFNATGGLERVRSFADLVRRIRYIPDSVIDRHLLPQSRILYPFPYHKEFVHYVGKTENLPADFKRIQTRYGNRPLGVRMNSTGAGPEAWRSYYNHRLADMVYKRYASDFAEFGYSRRVR